MDYKERINWLNNQSSNRLYKYLRNLRLYTNTPTLSLTNMLDNEVPGYYLQGAVDIDEDTTSPLTENIIRSCIATLTSKIASQKVRPFFNTVNGTFRDIQITKQAQHYFDLIYDDWNINKLISESFRDACIFDTGYVFLDLEQKKPIRAMPWQIYQDPRQLSYGQEVDFMYKQTQYPKILLDTNDDISKDISADISGYVTKIRYFNIKDHKQALYIPELNIYEESEYKADVLPLLSITYDTPIKGRGSNSVADELYGIQMELNVIMQKVKDASQLSPSNTIFVPENSSINASKLSNRVGEVITYSLSPNMTSSPVTVATPAFIDPEYLQLIEALKKDAYEIVGISQLSASGKKPEGLNSGVALGTMENIESDRFETQLNKVIRLYTDIAKRWIDIADGLILPSSKRRADITWSDLKNTVKNMSLQFSAAESLSKDPSQKLQQLQSLAAAGVIPNARIAQLMELPDVQSGYNIANNAINAVMTIIDRCINEDDYEVPVFAPLDMLKEEILSCCLSLEAGNAEKNYDDIQKLLRLYSNVEQQQKAAIDEMNAQMKAPLQEHQQAQNELDEAVSMNKQMDDDLASIQEITNGLQNGTIDPQDGLNQLKALQGGGN